MRMDGMGMGMPLLSSRKMLRFNLELFDMTFLILSSFPSPSFAL